MNAPKIFPWLLLMALLCVEPAHSAGDRGEFSKVLQTIPANGPLWKYGNVVMRRRSARAGMPAVVFAHWSHRARYTCRVCHLELGFAMRAGDSGISRNQNLSGKFCGFCHNGEAAFGVREADKCGRCHMKTTAQLEEAFESFAARLPMSTFGNGIDWAEALRNEQIKPLNTVLKDDLSMQFPEKLRAPMKLGTNSPRSDVTFSHRDHFAEMDCSSCHPDIFNIKKKGTEDFTMERNIYGNFCGACHMLVAFPMNDCRRCHSQMSTW